MPEATPTSPRRSAPPSWRCPTSRRRRSSWRRCGEGAPWGTTTTRRGSGGRGSCRRSPRRPEPELSPGRSPARPARTTTVPLIHAVVLGIAQGLTEFVPVSSSAHLELLPWFFGWQHFGGDATREQAFDVALHVGTLAGAVTFLRADIRRYAGAALGAVFGARTDGRRTGGDARVGFALALSAVPAAAAGLLLHSALVSAGEQIALIAVALAVVGWVLWWADRRAEQRTAAERPTDEFGVRDAVLLGVGQACALVPGVSRSAATIAVGRLLRFDRESAARVAFLMSLPVIAGAGVFRGLGLVGDSVPAGDLAAMGVGAAAAAATSWLVLGLVFRLLTPAGAADGAADGAAGARSPRRAGHRLFATAAVYRTALAAAVAVTLLAGWR
ncbi:MAG TPA: hypothetical protein DEP69_06440 [Acidimicrobiaceae bacterium]|nr:hypothetical protein [Acidimicrobiaceae bacterium]